MQFEKTRRYVEDPEGLEKEWQNQKEYATTKGNRQMTGMSVLMEVILFISWEGRSRI